MTRRRPLVVHVTTTDMSLELLLGPQLEAFACEGYQVLGASAPGPYVEALARRGIEHVALRHATRAVRPSEDVLALGELVRLFRRIRPDIVHTHNPKPGLYGRIAGRVAGVPVVVNTVHGLYASSLDHATRRAAVYGLERVAAAFSHAELVQNPEDVEVLRRLRVPADRLTVLGNGVDLTRFDPGRFSASARADARQELGAAGPGDVVVGVVGRLVREKGYPEVFAAAAMLRERAPHVRLAVIGPDDPDKPDALTAQDRAVAEDAGVRLLGARDDVDRLYTGMDLYVLASHREGFPRSAMEAAAMGLPVVATDIRGCRQVVDHGRTGLLVPVRDPVTLADAIVSLASEDGRRRSMGEAARRKALAEFDQRRCIERTLDVYRRHLDERAPATAHPG